MKSINYFSKKHKNTFVSARALIPGLKEVIKDRSLLGFIRIISYLIFYKIFYKRLISLILKNKIYEQK